MDNAMRMVERTVKTYEYWRSTDLEFATKVDSARARLKGDTGDRQDKEASDFAAFRLKYLGMQTFLHQHQWIDVIEGREPRDLHPEIKYEPGDSRYVLINCPPHHSKSMTLTVDYCTYRVCKDPNIRIKIVSKTQEMAKQFVYAIKQRLTHPRYRELQAMFGPPDGYHGKGSVWQSHLVYLDNQSRDSAEKDPTLEALGLEGHIYGARADLIILDDCIVLGNAHQYGKHIQWITQEVVTRLEDTGILLVCGTRVQSQDLYSEIRNPDRYPEGSSPWTYLAQPAVLEFHDDPKDWVTLWPKSDQRWLGTLELLKDGTPNPEYLPDENGLYNRWDGPRLYSRRGLLDAKTWSMVYMQHTVSEDSVFPVQQVRQCINGNRQVGLMSKDNSYHRDRGMDGLYIVCSMDPAMTQDTATVVYAVDPETHIRYVLDANRMPSPTPQMIKDLIRTWTIKYNPNCWVIEKNAFQLFLTRDEEIRSFLANRGVSMVEHYSSNNKLDPDFGVASLAPLFSEKMIDLASSHKSEGMKALVEQFITWRPGVKGKDLKQDFPMAIWFAELRCRLIVEQNVMKSASHLPSRYMPRYRRRKQNVIYLDDAEDEVA